MTEVRKIKARRQVSDALGTRNGPNDIVTDVIKLPLQSDVKVWRENHGWKGPHTLIALNDDQTAVVIADENGKQATFRITSVQPYHRDESTVIPIKNRDLNNDPGNNNDKDFTPREEMTTPPRRGRGRPKGSKNKPKVIQHPDPVTAHLTQREKDNLTLSMKLRATGRINTPGQPFEDSTQAEIDGLIARGVFRFET